MALGGGTFLVQNKVLPGAYINFVSKARASATLSDRGYATVPLILDWGVDGEVFSVENADVQKDSMEIFGYDYTHEKMKNIREIFKYAKTVYCYRLNSGTKAANDLATAKYSGVRGNDITVIVQTNIDAPALFDVITMVGAYKADVQTVVSITDLKNNSFVDWKTGATLSATAGMPLTGGTNKADITAAEYQDYLDKIESFAFNTMGCPSADAGIIELFVQFTKRMRDEVGAKFQTVIHSTTKKPDYEGVICLTNPILDADTGNENLIYWVTGASAGCLVNKSNTNKTYDGEYTIGTDYKQSALEKSIKDGKFMFHMVGEDVRVLDDVNSFVSVTVDKNEDFTSNQVIRVLDQIGNDIAVLFNTRYLGKVQNNAMGRLAFWNDLVKYNNEMEKIQAIENVVPDSIVVEKGDDKKSVVVTNPVTPVVAMQKLYMTVVVE